MNKKYDGGAESWLANVLFMVQISLFAVTVQPKVFLMFKKVEVLTGMKGLRLGTKF